MINFKTILLKIYFYLNYFLRYFFIKTNSKKISTNLILISQIQRSGGTLLSQLFDSHPQLHNYPSELKLTNPKFDWTKKMNFITFKNDPLLVSAAKQNNYKKEGAGIKNIPLKNRFKFNFFLQKKIFFNKKSFSLREKLNSYFTSFFNSFENYNNFKGSKKYIVAFLPRFILLDQNINLFYKSYKNGKIICIIRSPENWLASCVNHSDEYRENPLNTLMLWKMNTLMTLKAKKKFKKNVIIIDFNDLVDKTEQTMKKISKELKIKYNKSLTTPSFNGEDIGSNSSFKSTIGKIDKTTLKRKISKEFVKDYNAMMYECNYIKNDILKFKI